VFCCILFILKVSKEMSSLRNSISLASSKTKTNKKQQQKPIKSALSGHPGDQKLVAAQDRGPFRTD
jgi:hypothetical protein